MTKRSRRSVMMIGAALGSLLFAGCGTAQTSLVDDETASLGPARCPSGMLEGTGSRAQHNAIDQVGQSYEVRCDGRARITYSPSDSTTGITSFLAGTADWAGSESPLTPAQQELSASRCTAGEAWSLPLVVGPVGIAYSLPGVADLTLSPAVLGAIFDGTITMWDDPAITDLNPEADLPSAPLTVVARSGEDGLTQALTTYLAALDAWPAEAIESDWSGPGETLDKVAGLGMLRGTPHTIGYVEFSAALDNDLTLARLDSGSGPVPLTPKSAAAGLVGAELTGGEGQFVLTPNYAAGAGAYPLQTVTYQIVCTTGLTPASKTVLLKDFLGFLASDQQQTTLGELGYTPLPPDLRSVLREAITDIG